MGIIRLQTSIFGSYQMIDTSSPEMMQLYSGFLSKGLMPATLKEFDIAKQELKNRPFFVTKDNNLSVSICSPRIDIVAGNADAMPSKEDFIKVAKVIYEMIFDSIKIAANRISFVYEKEIKTIDGTFETVKEGETYLNFSQAYNKEKVFEWSANYVSEEQWMISELSELVNINMTVTKRDLMKINSQIPELHPILSLSQDLNTKAESTKERFYYQHVVEFLDKASNVSRVIEEQVK